MGYIIKNDGTILKKKKKEEEKNKVLTIKPFTYSDNNTNNFIEEDSFERKKSNNWVDAGALSDGYQFGDISKTVLGTGANVASGVLKGVSDVGFGTGKLVAGGVAQAADWLGQDKWANKVRNRIAGKDEETNKRLKAVDIFGNINEATQDASVLGAKGNEVTKSIGQIAGYGAASVVNPALGSAAMFGSSAGESLGEAYSKENVTNEQAWTKALVGGGISLATERLFGLFGKSGGIDKQIANKISSKLTSGMSKELARLGVQATAEATEELLEYAGNQLLDLGIDAASNGKGAKFYENWNLEEVGKQMAIAAVASGIVGAGTKAIGIRNTQGSNLQEKINNYALQEDIQEGLLPPQQENPLEKLQRTNIEQRQRINQQVEQELIQKENNKKIDTLEQQLEKQGTRILEDSISQREAMIESFKEYLEEHNITNPTQKDIDDSITDTLSYDNELDFADTARAEQLYNQYVREYMQENGIPFNNGDNIKQQQFDIIQKSNPMQDDYHTGIRSVEDIKTLEETLNDSDYIDYDEFNPDLTRQDIENAIKKGTITVYSSYPIENGVFVSPSRMEAESYSGNGKVYSKEVPISSVAWIDPTQGQIAIIPNIPTSRDFNRINLPTRQKVSLPTKSTTEVKTSPVEPKKTINKSTLTQAETKELNDLKTIDDAFGLDSEEEARMKFLEKKQQGYVERHSGLKKITDFKEISREYGKYKDLSDFNDKLLKDAEKTIQGYRNTGRRTKAEWLDIAKNIGSNYKGNSEGLTKYAIQSWFEAQPNQKDTLNRQGDKYVDFKIQEWVNAVYDGARIGELEKPLVPTAQQPKKETTSIPMVKNNESLKVESQRIANEINKNETFKQKGWLKTAMGSDVLKDSGLIKDLDPSQLNYVVQSNKSSVDKANNTINTLGYEKSLDKVKQIINDDKLPSASDVALMQRMIQEAAKRGDAATVQDLIMDTAIVGTDLGQATQALSIIQRLTPEGQLKLYTKLVQRAKVRGEKSFQNVEITPEMVENVLGAYNSDGTYDQDDLNARVEQFKQDLANQMKSTVGDKTNAWRYLAMLGNPKTHIRNIVSNVAMSGTIKVKNAMARTLETILPVEERTKTWKASTQDVKEFAKQTTANMKDIITGEAKYNEKSAIESKKQIFKNKALEKLSNFNGNALEAEDWFFSSRAFQSTLQEYLTANGINTYEDIQNNPEIVEKAKNYAKDQAEIATFRQYSKLAATINQIEKKNKGAKLAVQALMPFKKTPINVAKAGIKYSPLGLAKTLIYDGLVQLRQGNIEASQFIDNLSQGLTGTSLTLLGYALAKAGFLNGSGGDDKDDKYDSQLGNTGYSLNIGGNSYSISWLSPVAMPLLVGSNAYEQLEEDKDWDANVVSDTLAKTLDPLNEMSFMQGLTNALQSYGSGTDKIKGSLESTAQNYVGQFFPTIFSQLASTLDDKKRSTKASNDSKYKFGEQTVRSIMYKIPGLRQKLEATTDIWGNEKEQSDNIIERAFESFIAPYSKTKQIETNLDKEIKRLYNETGETGVIPGIPNSYVKYKNETYRMSANEYTDYKKTYGQNANKYLNNLIDSNSYKTASDKVKAKMIDNVYDYAKAEANEQYFKKNNVDYTSDELKELEALREEGITGKQLANYVADKTQISSIKSDNDLSTKEKKNKILNIFENSELNNDQLSYLYSGYYSTEEKVRAINNVNIPIKEFIKYDLQDFESDYNAKNGKAVSNSKKAKVINYINNNLKLSAAQKALLIKLEYNTFKGYDNQIVNYIKSSNAPYLDKAYLLKRAGFNNFDREIINYVQSHIKTAKDKEEILKNMGFTVRNGRVYK